MKWLKLILVIVTFSTSCVQSLDNDKKFTLSDKLMEEEKFWEIIQRTKDNAKDDFEVQKHELEIELRKLTLDDIILFENRFRYFRGKANTWELRGAIYIIYGGCGDDSFNDFREWVISQGKNFYYKTLEDPESLVDFDADIINNLDWEGLGYVPSKVFSNKSGEEIPATYKEAIEIKGKKWSEDGRDLENMFPRLYSKFSNQI